MEAHVREYDVDIMNLQRVSKITGANQTANGLVEVELENGAKLESKTVILSTGARWREMNVPGEQNTVPVVLHTAHTVMAHYSKANVLL